VGIDAGKVRINREGEDRQRRAEGDWRAMIGTLAGIVGAALGAKKKAEFDAKKWKRAIEESFPDSAPANIVMTGGEKLNLAPKCQTESCDSNMRFASKEYSAYKDQMEVWWTCPNCASKVCTPFNSIDLATSPVLSAELKRIEEQEAVRRVEETRGAAMSYKRPMLTKEQAEQLRTGKIPPMPGDNLPMSEWMRLREGLPTTEEAQEMKRKQQQADALRALAAQQNDAMRQYQQRVMVQYEPTATGIAGMAAAQQGVTSFAARMELGWLGEPTLRPDPPKKRPAKPEKTTEEAQQELTETGRRKIILDSE
jgi:hypothetical protein